MRDLQTWTDVEKRLRLFSRQVRLLTEDEKDDLRPRLTYIRQDSSESPQDFFARNQVGKIVLPIPMWRLELYREVL